MAIPSRLIQVDLRSAESQIRDVAGRYLFIEGIEHSRYWYRLSGNLKMPEGSIPDDMPPARVRLRLLFQAENLLSALSKAGWQLADGTIDISFRTDVSGPLMTLAGVVVQPSRQGSTTAFISILIMKEIGL